MAAERLDRAMLLDDGARRLEAVATSPRTEAGRLLARALGLARGSDLYRLPRGAALTEASRARYEELLAARASGVPIQYVLGTVDFYESRFEARPGVFIPRPETEGLVDAARDALEDGGHVLELGTGSGAVIASVMLASPRARGVAVDVSPAAISLAARNASRVGVDDRVTFLLGDLYEPLEAGVRFDVIVSNPPYVATGDPLPDDVRDHEPLDALYAGSDGLDVIRRIVAGASRWLVPGGSLAFEIGETQGPAVRELLAAHPYEHVRVDRDLAGKDRIARARVAGGA